MSIGCFRSGLSQHDTTLLYSFFRLYYWSHLKSLPNSTTTQFVDFCLKLLRFSFNNVVLRRFLTINTTTNIADELQISSTLNDQICQTYFLSQPPTSFRVLVINISFITMFFFFQDSKFAFLLFSISISIDLF